MQSPLLQGASPAHLREHFPPPTRLSLAPEGGVQTATEMKGNPATPEFLGLEGAAGPKLRPELVTEPVVTGLRAQQLG